jgi:hypothetical protein
MRTTLSFSKYAKQEQLVEVIKKILDRVQAEPGVISAAISSSYPLEPETIAAGPNAFTGTFKIRGRDLAPGEAPPVGRGARIRREGWRKRPASCDGQRSNEAPFLA